MMLNQQPDRYPRCAGMPVLIMLSIALLASSCQSIDPRALKPWMFFQQEKVSAMDAKAMAESIADEMIVSFLESQRQPPIMVLMNIENKTTQRVNTAEVATWIRAEVNRSRRARFVRDAALSDVLTKYKDASSYEDPETRKLIGMQLGARYLVQGRLQEIEDDGTKLFMEIIDLENGETAWATTRQVESPN